MSAPWDFSRLWQSEQADAPYPNPAGSERRSNRRYPIRAGLEYRLTKGGRVLKSGRGFTVNMSRNGILFESTLPLARGLKIELCIAWPAFAGDSKRLELHAEGRTVRMQENRTAVQIHKYTFRAAASTTTHEP